MEKSSIIIRFEQSNKQTMGKITKIVGLVQARFIVPIIDDLDLEANPRASKTGAVTEAIQETIQKTPQLMPFKTKGILLASSYYEELDRNRFKIIPQDRSVEGILDGGHNTLAIGMYILQRACDYAEVSLPKKQQTWESFKKLWNENHELIEKYLDAVKHDDGQKGGTVGSLKKEMNFFVPVELLVPRDIDDEQCAESFTNDLFEICEARNNNAELQLSAKANQKGHFDTLKALLDAKNPVVSERIEWKPNTGGDIKAQDLIALSWIPLSLIDPVTDESNKKIEAVAPNKLYSGKGSCLKQFEKLMSSPDVSVEDGDNYKSKLNNSEIESALAIAAQMPEIYDYVYEKFPELYNRSGGSYGRISAVKKLNENRKKKTTPYMDREVDTLSPEGFIMPLIYGLKALMEKKELDNGDVVIQWKDNKDPMTFLDENLENIVDKYRQVFTLCEFDPQKVGKANMSYTQAYDAFKMALANVL